ncbi:MAG: DUF4040 domain-containing protein [Thermosynechococcaceae cyanobacterium]
MTDQVYMIAITALLPLTAGMLVLQVNPYHALVIRGILGAIAALVYVLFGAADVALTEALVGTMLSITLYAVAVRSSMSLRVGVLQEELETPSETPMTKNPASDQVNSSDYPSSAEPCVSALKNVMGKHYLRLEWTLYTSLAELNTALHEKEIHAALSVQTQQFSIEQGLTKVNLRTRVQRLYDIMTAELPASANVQVTYTHDSPSAATTPKLVEEKP